MDYSICNETYQEEKTPEQIKTENNRHYQRKLKENILSLEQEIKNLKDNDETEVLSKVVEQTKEKNSDLEEEIKLWKCRYSEAQESCEERLTEIETLTVRAEKRNLLVEELLSDLLKTKQQHKTKTLDRWAVPTKESGLTKLYKDRLGGWVKYSDVEPATKETTEMGKNKLDKYQEAVNFLMVKRDRTLAGVSTEEKEAALYNIAIESLHTSQKTHGNPLIYELSKLDVVGVLEDKKIKLSHKDLKKLCLYTKRKIYLEWYDAIEACVDTFYNEDELEVTR